MITANHSARRSDRSDGGVMLPVVLPVWDAKGDLVRVYVQVQAGRVRVSDDGWFLFDAVCAGVSQTRLARVADRHGGCVEDGCVVFDFPLDVTVEYAFGRVLGFVRDWLDA